MFFRILWSSILGAIVGWIIGITLTRVMFAIENRRLERKEKKRIRKMEKNPSFIAL